MQEDNYELHCVWCHQSKPGIRMVAHYYKEKMVGFLFVCEGCEKKVFNKNVVMSFKLTEQANAGDNQPASVSGENKS